MQKHTYSLQDVTIEDIYEISLASARAKEKKVKIYEMSNLTDLIGMERAEEIRRAFLENGTKVEQITNSSSVPAFSKDDEFINNCMSFRYIPKETFTIENEVLIFDDTVAIYTCIPSPKLAIIRDKSFALNQKQLFGTLWDNAQPPALGFPYTPNHSLYNSIDFQIGGKQVIIYPDRDALDAYVDFSYEDMRVYFEKILAENKEYYDNAEYIISFIWSFEKDKMVDMWKFNSNHVDDRSGPLSEVKIFQNGKECTNLGMASGNTLLVLGLKKSFAGSL